MSFVKPQKILDQFDKHPLIGRNYDHRKEWLQDGMEDLAAIFAVDVLV